MQVTKGNLDNNNHQIGLVHHVMHIDKKGTTLSLSCEVTPMQCPLNIGSLSQPRCTHLEPNSLTKICQ